LTRAFAHKNTIDAFTHTLIRALQHNPFHHASALLLAMHVYLHNGWTTYILKNYSFEKMLSTIQVCKINFFFTFPWVVSALSKEPIVEKYDTSSLVFATCGGSRIEKSVIMAFHKRFRIPILNFYGMTEILGFLEPTFENTLAGIM
jgi:4-coumarate--CoA ligase